MEVAWPGCVVLILVTLLAWSSAVLVHNRELARLEEARWLDVLLDLRRQIETDLALGFALAHSVRAQGLLEGAVARSHDLQALTVFDVGGETLFDTDRSAIGESAPDTWRRAAGDAAWRVASGADTTVTIGLPLRGPLGNVTGQVTLTLSLPADALPWLVPVGISVLLLGIAAALALLPLAQLDQRLESSQGTGEDRLDGAEGRLDVVDAALRVDPQEPRP